MMKDERMIEILAEETQIKEVWLSQDPNILITTKSALTAMQRAVEEETATLRAEVERLKGVIPTNEEIAIEVVARFMHNPHPNQRDKYAREKQAFIDGVEWITQRHRPPMGEG